MDAVYFIEKLGNYITVTCLSSWHQSALYSNGYDLLCTWVLSVRFIDGEHRDAIQNLVLNLFQNETCTTLQKEPPQKMSRSWTSLILQPPPIGHVSRNLPFPTMILKGEWNYEFQKENKTMC